MTRRWRMGRRAAGAVTCVSGMRNAVHAARAVMERTPDVVLSGAERWNWPVGKAWLGTGWLVVTARRQEQLTKVRRGDRAESEVAAGPWVPSR
jgi:isoaspartyl peptidase/L-asparaginase-like protein (Ntn-hydrolase superfamily)